MAKNPGHFISNLPLPTWVVYLQHLRSQHAVGAYWVASPHPVPGCGHEELGFVV